LDDFGLKLRKLGFRWSNYAVSVEENDRSFAQNVADNRKPKTQMDLSGNSVDDSKFSVQPAHRYLIQKPQLTIQ